MSSILDWIGRKVEDLVALGYPESVAKRISSGELPMDEASRMARAKQLGYDVENPQYHGTRADILEIITGNKGKMGAGVYTSPEPRVSNRYATPGFNSNKDISQIDPDVLNEELMSAMGGNVIPMVLRGNRANRMESMKANPDITVVDGVEELARRVREQGYAGMDASDPFAKQTIKESVTYDPSNTKSYLSAAFDPEYKGPNIMGALSGLTAGGLGLGAALTSEDAEASPFGDVANTADRMLKLGMISPDTLKNPSAVKSAITRYNKYLKESKAFREREHMAAAADDFVNFQQTDLGGRIVADLEKMIGKPIMPVRGDKSDIGTIVSANGIDINTPVQGGSKFSQANTDADRGWMSMYGVAKGVQSKIMNIAKDLEVEPIAIYNAMGRDSVNFSTPVAEAMFKQLDELPIAKADIKEFDAAMRKAYPKWVGLKSENAMDQLMGVGDFPMEGAGKMRTAFSVLMGQDKFQKRGFPSYDKIVDAITDPALRDVEKGGSGLSMYQTIANPIFRELGVHKSYDAVMPGNYIGGLPDDRSIPFEVMFPEVFSKMSKMTDKHGNPLSRDLIINTANMSGEGWQIADDAWFDGIQKYLKENPKSVGTGSAILGALSGNAMAGTDVPDYAMPMAVQAAGQSDLSGKANPGREVGTVLAGLDMLLPLVGEAFKPATMGNAELTDEIRKRGYYGM